MINYRLYPKHLGEIFIHKYREILDRRVDAKHNGLDDENDALKIVLNSTFGKTIFKNHWLYDPLVGYKTTINGQLFLLMLIEKLVLNGFKVISANTDGVVALVDVDKEELYYKLCKEWEYETSFNLEYTEYKKYIRRDVNNYITIKTNDKIKQKGIFSTDLDLKKGFDKPIISIALYEFFINNKPIKETILNHKDIYDFCTSKKTDAKFTNEFHYLEDNQHKVDILQHIVRFYISKHGGTLYKKTEDNFMISYCVGKYVTIFNDYIHRDNIAEYNIDYPYYINETQKIIDQIINPQLTLF
jgi:DNA polymerase elongation subunit (family B)